MAAYVEGEAPETDSEDEQYLFNLSYMKVRNRWNEIDLKHFFSFQDWFGNAIRKPERSN